MTRTLDIGCGNTPVKGAVGVDILPYDKIDVQGDATCLPFQSDIFEKVHASQVLEHLNGRAELPQLFEEVWRVLKPGGEFVFDVPIGEAWNADPTHVSKWRFKTIVYFLTRSEVQRLGWDPEQFPDYYSEREFDFELIDWECEAWLWANSLPLRALSFLVNSLSTLVTTDKWVALPLGSGNLKISIKKVS